MPVFRRDPQSLLDYKIRWDSWLGTDQIISANATASRGTPTADSALKIANNTVSGSKSHVIWLSAGTLGNEYNVTSKIFTSGGRRNLRTFSVRMEET